MRVVHLSSAHLKNDIRICIKECQSLVNNGYDVSYVVWGQEEEVINGVKVINSGVREGSRYTRFIKGAKAVYKKAVELNADVYHFHDPELLWYGLKLKRKGYKVIYDVHEGVPDQIMSKYWIPKALRKFVSKAFESFEFYCSKRFDAILTATPHIAKPFKSINKKVEVINNFPLFGDIEPGRPWEEKADKAVYAGGITEIRGVLPLAEAIQKSSYRLNLAGKYLPASLQDQVNSIDKSNLIDFKGMLNRVELNELLNESKVGIVTFLPAENHISAQPNKMFEYMAAGIPVICSHFELWKMIIDDAKCGITVDPDNPEELSKAIVKILSNDSLARELGENGRKAILEKYNWKVEERKLVSIYESINVSV